MYRAKKHGIGESLHTAASASHPESPGHEGRPTMSGRKFKEPEPQVGRPRRIVPHGRGGSIVSPPGGGRPAAYAPNGGTYKPGSRGGRGY